MANNFSKQKISHNENNISRYFLIGHRGVGKSTLLEDFKNKSKDFLCFDLDHEIENRAHIKIIDFINQGRIKEFRVLELKTLAQINSEFNQLLKSSPNKKLMIALGAGFELSKFKFPKNSMVLWLRRSTDSKGRIFFDRPALTKLKNPLNEWTSIFQPRELNYKKYSTAQIYIPEYFDSKFNALYEYLNFKAPGQGFVTLIPKENDQILKKSKCCLELRTDLLSEKMILNVLKTKDDVQNLVAIRTNNKSLVSKIIKLKKQFDSLNTNIKKNILINDFVKKTNDERSLNLDSKILVDWDMSLGFPPESIIDSIDIYSSHDDDPIPQILIFEDYLKNTLDCKKNIYYKICPCVESHQEALDLESELSLILNPATYSFLPRSNSLGVKLNPKNWDEKPIDLSYYRQVKSYTQKIGFYRFGEGSSSDQPVWWQWPSKNPKGFYGIYGQNIAHSYTPSFHFSFFQTKNLWPISLDSLDGLLDNKAFLTKNKIKALAVTSPYKAEIFKQTEFQKTENSNPIFKSANTLVLTSKILSFDTDFVGLTHFFKKHVDPNLVILVWGGGALLNQMKSILPKATFYSAQTGRIREDIVDNKIISKLNIKVSGKIAETESNMANSDRSQSAPDLNKILNPEMVAKVHAQLIWASGEKGILPDHLFEQFNISKIIDLDYRENSKAKLYSCLNSINYVSGLDFFILQAKAQQKIWDTYEF
jgi:shikimate kinase